MTEFMLAALTHNKIDHGSADVRTLPAPTELSFELDTPSKQYISEAEKNFDTLISKHDMEVRHR